MNITPISYNSNYNTQKCRKPSFQAKLTPALRDALITTAQKEKRLPEFIKKFNKLENWGKGRSTIRTSVDLKKGTESLVLSNPNMSKLYNGNLGIKEDASLLDQFLSLNKTRIQCAEKDIERAVQINELEAIDKIVETPAYMKKLTGKTNPTDEELAVAIEKLSEEQLAKYRFNMVD